MTTSASGVTLRTSIGLRDYEWEMLSFLHYILNSFGYQIYFSSPIQDNLYSMTKVDVNEPNMFAIIMWVEFAVGSRLAPSFFPSFSGFLPPTKTTPKQNWSRREVDLH